ncbi:hypothetical protein EV424DRAFT_310258 [Suillus variegatus]|nr:hypothetical protein EV424DRAFT_310258 [Suillus variegatus]
MPIFRVLLHALAMFLTSNHVLRDSAWPLLSIRMSSVFQLVACKSRHRYHGVCMYVYGYRIVSHHLLYLLHQP